MRSWRRRQPEPVVETSAVATPESVAVDEPAELEPVEAEHVCYCRYSCECFTRGEVDAIRAAFHFASLEARDMARQREDRYRRRRPMRRTERV